MLRKHFKIALRFFIKNRLFSLINTTGLAVGIAAFIILIQYIAFEKSYDKDLDHVYRVTLSSGSTVDRLETAATNHPAVGPAMKAEFPEIESFARMVDMKLMNARGVLSYIRQNGDVVRYNLNDFQAYYSDGKVLELFQIPLIGGTIETTLDKPGTVVISERTAKQFFGDEDPIGKSIIVNSEYNAIVNGVFKNLPQNTHLNFDFLVSFSTLGQGTDANWAWPEFYNYVKTKPGTSPQVLEAKLPQFVDKNLGDIMDTYGFKVRMNLQPVGDIHLTNNLKKEMSINSSPMVLNFLVIIAFLVIGIALTNFINMSTAKSLERAKEVGLKKVIGANRKMLIAQFLIESLMINFFSILIALVLVILLMEPFNALVQFEVLDHGMWNRPLIWLSLLTLLLFGGILAGLYPAFVLSKFRPVEVLKGRFHQSGNGLLLRKGLIIGQFVISIALVSGTYIVFNQYSFMQDQDLGFESEQNIIVNTPIDWNSDEYSSALDRLEVFKNQLTQDPNINSVSLSTEIPGKTVNLTDGIRKPSESKKQSRSVDFLPVDHDFIKTYGLEVIAGRGFRREDKTEYFPDDGMYGNHPHKVIINESAARALEYNSPEEAIHQKVTFKYGPAEQTAEIIGVIRDYHQQSLRSGIANMMLMYEDRYLANYITINVGARDLKSTLATVESEFQRFFPKDPFNYFFLDEYFNKQYQADIKIGTICMLFSILAIFIAAIGLFGMGSQMALQKLKEIGIRKVLGASNLQTLLLIPKNLLSLVGIAGIIAIPLIYFAAQYWLETYEYRMYITVWMFFIPFVLVLVVALLAISMQSVRALLVNPAETLRND
ncbi:ABC transporter permease [Arenibacter sp. M-2]|uniref:ABC transporter permease n=1 Tax=Arenibacter sp. M-2 TaxID=3053612 RepID=UPI0025703F9A|nr:ABC transporter permease [Arenibacter sp. M-2]MDL5511124.1 ABC transporter permease [Arenibacter sp. M-2]